MGDINYLEYNIDPQRLPAHVGIIMDGNGRWAQNRGQLRIYGHKAGASRVRDITEVAVKVGIKALTLFAFSEENWQRPQKEITALMQLLNNTLNAEKENLYKHNIKLKVIGDISKLSKKTQKVIFQTIQYLSANTGLVLTIALSYSGQYDILEACKKIAQLYKDNSINLNDIDQLLFNNMLQTYNLPPLDLIIRTGGELRLSNFMLWQAAYSELYFTKIYWPDFDKKAFIEALVDFQKRDRRFGQVKDKMVKKYLNETQSEYQ